MLEVVLNAGDVLYMPRGTIHQATAMPDVHSLHVTVSTYHQNTWADALELAVVAAVRSAAAESLPLRRGRAAPPRCAAGRLAGVHTRPTTMTRAARSQDSASIVRFDGRGAR